MKKRKRLALIFGMYEGLDREVYRNYGQQDLDE